MMAHTILGHLIVHWAGVTGLALNTAGAIGLLRYSSEPDAGSVLSHETLQALRSGPGMEGPRREYQRKVRAYQLSFGALIASFVLQLIDLLLS